MDGDRELTRRLKDEARRLGFDRVGVAPIVDAPDFQRYLDWLDAGHAAGMSYLSTQAAPRANPGLLFEGARSLVMASQVYGGAADPAPGPTEGKVARYARGLDYHEWMWRRLETLLAWLRSERPGTQGRAIADSAPLLERDFARLAGLGWVGKNTLLIDRRLGSYTVLGALVTDVALVPDEPFTADHCGTCTRCLDACPTDAFVGPYQLDARRCLSYWTIEHRGPIDPAFADQLDGWVFGCDVCQEVCPWNRKAAQGCTPALQPSDDLTHPDLIAWLDTPAEEMRRLLKPTALARTKRAGLLRNAALILGTRGVVEAVPALIRRLDDDNPVIRDAAAWALRRISSVEAYEALAERGLLW